MIMGIEGSGIQILAEAIKTKLLQEVRSESNEGAHWLAAKFRKGKRDKSEVRCYNCNQFGHYSRDCKSKKEVKVLFSSFVARDPIDMDDWYVDLGASGHMTIRKENLFDASMSSKGQVVVADNSRMDIECTGNLRLNVRNGERIESVIISDVQCIPKLCANLLLMSQMVCNGNTVIFDSHGCHILDAKKNLVATTSLCNNMYKLPRDDVSRCFSLRTESIHALISTS